MTESVARAALAFAPLFLLPWSSGRAQDPGDEVVVTATREPEQIKQTIQHTTVITEEEIRASQAVDVPTLLRKEAGIQITQSGGPGQTAGLFVRGAATNQTLVLIDGVRVNSATTGTTQIDQLMLDEIERIEIVRGPGSSLYGSDAIGGVVQIFTKRGLGVSGPNATVGFGNQGTQRYALGYGGTAGDLQYSLNASAFRTDGFSAIRPEVSPVVNPDADGYRNYSGTAAATYTFDPRNSVGFTYYAAGGEVQFDDPFAASRDDRQTGRTGVSSANMFTRNQFTESWTSRVSASEGVDRFRNFLNDQQTSFFQTRNSVLTWQNDLALATGQRVILGAETLNQQVSSTTVYTTDERRVNSVFGGYTGTFGRSTLQGNVRNDHYSDFGSATTYLAGYGYQLTDTVRAVASASRGFRAPTFNELFFPGFGNPNLQPEIANAIEGGLQYAAGRQLARLAVYRTRYTDLINPFPIANINQAQVTGVELSYVGAIGATDVRASLTFQDPRDLANDQLLIRRATRLGSFTVGRAFGPFGIGAEMVAVGPRFDNDQVTFDRVSLPGYAIFNLVGRYNFTKNLYLGVRAENIFDKDYSTASGFNAQRFLVLVTLNYVPAR